MTTEWNNGLRHGIEEKIDPTEHKVISKAIWNCGWLLRSYEKIKNGAGYTMSTYDNETSKKIGNYAKTLDTVKIGAMKNDVLKPEEADDPKEKAERTKVGKSKSKSKSKGKGKKGIPDEDEIEEDKQTFESGGEEEPEKTEDKQPKEKKTESKTEVIEKKEEKK